MLGRMSLGARRAGWWSRRGVRSRSTIVAVAVVAVAVVIGGVGLVAVLDIALTNSIRQGVTQRAQDIAAQIASDDVAAASATAGAAPGDATIVQVVNSAGAVVLSSPSIDGEPSILPPDIVHAGLVSVELPLAFVDNEVYLVVAARATAPSGDVTVIAAQSLGSVQRVVQLVVLALAVATPFLLAAVGAVTWVAVGRSLATVDRIRIRVEDIGAADLSERVPVPPAKDEIERLAVTMNHMLDRLEHAMTSQRQFVADASHELKSPLASMRASLDVAARTADGVNPAVHGVLSDEVDRMTRLVSDLLLLAKSDEGLVVKRRMDVDVDDLVLAEAERLRGQSPLTVLIDIEAARVQADPDQLSQAVRNLVDNAARFASTTILLRVRVTATRVLVTVEDDGPGIPVQEREAVFDRFVRLDDHRSRDDGGAGLGLAIVREIARMHGGDARIGASDLGGVAVRLDIPTG